MALEAQSIERIPPSNFYTRHRLGTIIALVFASIVALGLLGYSSGNVLAHMHHVSKSLILSSCLEGVAGLVISVLVGLVVRWIHRFKPLANVEMDSQNLPEDESDDKLKKDINAALDIALYPE